MRRDFDRVGVWGFFGIGNIGNEASLEALLVALRASRPEARVTCFAPRPGVVRIQHDVSAIQLMAFRGDSRRPGPITHVLKIVGRLWDLPRTWRMVGAVDVVVVPGMGVLESDLMGSPWGMPYWLLLITLLGRLRGRPVVLLSVGAVHSPSQVTRHLNRWTVRLAAYCSFRDHASRTAASGSGRHRATRDVVPDLAFALPPPRHALPRQGHVVIGVMAYDGPGCGGGGSQGVREEYLDKMATLVVRLIDSGRTVTLVIGDAHDEPVAVELAQRVGGRSDLRPCTLTISSSRTFESLMEDMACAEVVVASRFHNVVAALKAERPTVSLGYASKNENLLRAVGLGTHDQRLHDFDVEQVLNDIDGAVAHQGLINLPVMIAELEQGAKAEFTRVFDMFLPSEGTADAARSVRSGDTGVG